jgi:hypothetical protein
MEKPRLTIYCQNEERQQYIRNGLAILKNKYHIKTNDELIEWLIRQELRVAGEKK